MSVLFFFFLRNSPQWATASSFTRFLDHTQPRTTFGRTPLVDWLDRRRDLYLTKHTTHHRQTSLSPVWFEPTISAEERPQTYSLERAATGAGVLVIKVFKKYDCVSPNWGARVGCCWLQTLPETITWNEQFSWSSTGSTLYSDKPHSGVARPRLSWLRHYTFSLSIFRFLYK
jgi:hypothetical protein